MFSLFISVNFLSAQDVPENYFEQNYAIEVVLQADKNVAELLEHPGIILDHGSNNEWINLYVTQEGFNHLQSQKVAFQIKKPEVLDLKMLDIKSTTEFLKYKSTCMPVMDFYPTYDAYEMMMYNFESQYPDLCEIIELGTLSSGRKLLVAHIGDNLSSKEIEPGFFYTSTMHGDELAGYPLMLMYIDQLLCNYGSDQRITNLVNDIDIYVLPIMNPDGAYRGGNETLENSMRPNNNFVDLNRNFPDPKAGPNPDGRTYQPETEMIMSFAFNHDINMSCNLHGGAELINYPWDTFIERHADDDWCQKVCRDYADTTQFNSPSAYFIQRDNGVTNGYDWFEIEGGIQDFMNYNVRSRDVTLELSLQKRLNANRIPEIWNSNKNALLNYMNESLYGLHGTVLDCQTGLPIDAEIYIEDHDKLNSSVFTHLETGAYYRYLAAGDYNISFLAAGYDTLVMPASIEYKNQTVLNVELCPIETSTSEESLLNDVQVTQFGNEIWISSPSESNEIECTLFDIMGRQLLKSNVNDGKIVWPDYIPGHYFINLRSQNQQLTKRIILK